MQKKLLQIGITTILLASCAAQKMIVEPPVPDAVTEELEQEAEDALQEPKISEAQALLRSYEEAVKVRDLVIETSQQMDKQTQDAIAEALAVFSADIESLKYYVDLADREPLLDDDHRAVVELIADIEEAMELFAYVLELIL